MNNHKKLAELLRFCVALFCLSIAAGVCGCNKSASSTASVAPPTPQQQIQNIQNNPHMPPDVKAQAAAALQSTHTGVPQK